MRILIVGAGGMLGHTLFRYFASLKRYEVFGSIRQQKGDVKSIYAGGSLLQNFNVMDITRVRLAIEELVPDVIINCVGIIKQIPSASDSLMNLRINSILPRQLASITETIGARLIHFSTDCVFSGSRGLYTEQDMPDAQDLYGLSKYAGEVVGSNVLTLRTSIIGHEINRSTSLLEWFLSQRESVMGFKKAIFSGLTTYEVAKFLDRYILRELEINGMYHLSSDPINKYDLLNIVKGRYELSIEIKVNQDMIIDRSLDSSLLRALTGYVPPSWDTMIEEMRNFG
jgi:dTDP-4-dehydrorhamnose reductase